MARELKIYCDKCGEEIDTGSRYFTVRVKEFVKLSGKQIQYPTIWLCKNCFLQTGLTFPNNNSEGGKQYDK